jgi:hypothetical protein
MRLSLLFLCGLFVEIYSSPPSTLHHLLDELVDEMPDARSTISYSLILSEQVARRWMIRATTCKAIHSGFKTSVELTDQALITSY